VNDKANGINITASRFDTEDSGFATGLSTCITKDGQQTTTASIPFAVGINVNQGSVSSPSIAITGDLSTGFYQTTSGEIRFASEGVNTATLNATGLVTTQFTQTTNTSTGSSNAYVVAVTGTPTLAVGSTFQFKASFANTGAATVNFGTLGAINIYKQGASGATALIGGEIESGQLVTVKYDGSEFQLVSPVAGSISSNGTYAAYVVQAGSSQAYFGSTGTNQCNVVADCQTASQYVVYRYTDAGTSKWDMGKSNTNTWYLYDYGNGKNQITANPSGNLTLGAAQTCNFDQNGRLFINGSSVIGGENAWVQVGVNSSGNTAIAARAGTNNYIMNIYSNAGTAVGSISTTSSATSFNTSSDKRLKNNVAALDNVGAKIDALTPVTYNWQYIEGNPSGTGFLAQDLHEIIPEAVFVGDNEPPTESGGVAQRWSVDYSKLVPYLVAEIKELRQRVALLEAKGK